MANGQIIDNSVIFNVVNETGTFTFDYQLQGVVNVGVAVVCTPVSSGTGTLSLLASNDGTNYADVPDTDVSITGAGTTILAVLNPSYKFLRIKYVAASNGMTMVGTVCAR